MQRIFRMGNRKQRATGFELLGEVVPGTKSLGCFGWMDDIYDDMMILCVKWLSQSQLHLLRDIMIQSFQYSFLKITLSIFKEWHIIIVQTHVAEKQLTKNMRTILLRSNQSYSSSNVITQWQKTLTHKSLYSKRGFAVDVLVHVVNCELDTLFHHLFTFERQSTVSLVKCWV